jgi:PilZ domain-containing protein
LIEYTGPERRGKPRIREAFPVKVMGKDLNGQIIEADILLENLSASGLYLIMKQKVAYGARLTLIVQFFYSNEGQKSVARVSARGVVVRVEPRPNGTEGLAVAFKSHRFL